MTLIEPTLVERFHGEHLTSLLGDEASTRHIFLSSASSSIIPKVDLKSIR